MIVRLDRDGSALLEDAANFRAFKVVAPAGGQGSLVMPADLGAADPDGAHVWVDAAWLANAGPADERWRAGLDEMHRFARHRGWTDAQGRLRAHVEFRGD